MAENSNLGGTMPQFIKHISAVGLHGRFNLELEFKEGVNIVHGSNGSGKTTLLHILANATNLDLQRFTSVRFREIRLELSDSSEIKIIRKPGTRTTELLFNESVIDNVSFDEEDTNSDPRERPSYRILNQRNSRLRNRTKLTALATYFPAFRTMIEAWSSVDDDDLPVSYREIQRRARPYRYGNRRGFNSTAFARRLFGKFVPSLNYPSPLEIEKQINGEIRQAIYRVAQNDRFLLSSVFEETFLAITGNAADMPEPSDTRSILGQMERLSDKLQETPIRPLGSQSESVYEQLRKRIPDFRSQQQGEDLTTRRVLSIYEESLSRRLDIQTKAFASVNDYIASVNRFLEDKELVVESRSEAEDREQPMLGVKFSDGRVSRLSTLSSGERQVIGLIYAASHIGEANIILIDEPELSLHVDWQRKLIDEMVNQLPSKQLIVCTHSPIIGAAFQDNMIELRPSVSSIIYEEDLYTDAEEAYVDFDFEDLDLWETF